MIEIKKKILTLILAAGLLEGILSQNVYAASSWQKTSDGWQYYENAIIKTDWLLSDDKWYHFDDNGMMQIGWIDDKNIWYYLSDNGALDESRTTTVMPDEIRVMYDIVNVYNDSGIVRYSSVYYVNDKGCLNEAGLGGKSLYRFYSEDQLGNEISEYYYDSYNGNVYKLKQGIVTLLNTNTVINNVNRPITVVEAVEKVKDYLLMNGKYVPNTIRVESDNGDEYLVHCYDDTDIYNSIGDLYYVNKTTGYITSVF
jgi:hypothetical protein